MNKASEDETIASYRGKWGESIAHRVKMRKMGKMRDDAVHRYHGDSLEVCKASNDINGDGDLVLAMAMNLSQFDAKSMATGLLIDDVNELDDLVTQRTLSDLEESVKKMDVYPFVSQPSLNLLDEDLSSPLFRDEEQRQDMHYLDQPVEDLSAIEAVDSITSRGVSLYRDEGQCQDMHYLNEVELAKDLSAVEEVDSYKLMNTKTKYVDTNLSEADASKDDVMEYETDQIRNVYTKELKGKRGKVRDAYAIHCKEERKRKRGAYATHGEEERGRKRGAYATHGEEERGRKRGAYTTHGEEERGRKRGAYATHREEQRDRKRPAYAIRKEHERKRYVGTQCDIDKFDATTVEPFDCGLYDKVCKYCNALGYEGENKATKKKEVHFGKLCCNQGKIKLQHLPWLHRPADYCNYMDKLTKQQLNAVKAWEDLTNEQCNAAEELYHLFVDNTKEARYFRNNLRKFNAAMSMASLQVTDATMKKGTAAAFKVCGTLYRRVGPMLPSLLPDLGATCTQVYFLDPEYQAELRASRFKDAKQRQNIYQYDLVMFKKLHRILLACKNTYLRSFLSAHEFVQQRQLNPDDIEFEIHPLERPQDAYQQGLSHPGRYHLPSVPEISILIPNQEHPGAERSVVCQMRQSTMDEAHSLKFVSDGHRSYEPLQYELLRPFGTDGWNYNTLSGTHKVSIPEYTRYHMMERVGEESMLHRSKKLFQQYVTDQYGRAESRSLGYLKSQAMQTKLRRDSRFNVIRSVLHGNIEQSGRQTILPSSHTGSDRWYYKKFQDVMAIVGEYGKPHLWITNTMNINCKEAKDRLRPGETSYDRPDILIRLFRLRNDAMMDDIIKHEIFGKVVAYVTVIEFQKRGAPHSHSLIWLEDFDLTVKNIDNMISAEIPPENSLLHPFVRQFMLHRCGQWCQRDGQCKDNFPFDFSDDTFIVEDAYPRYRRRSPASGGNTCDKRYDRKPTTVTNQNVVPYSPYLLMKYQCHVNVQMCNSFKAVKYLCFYPLKGEDLMLIKVDVPNRNDEIGRYETRRYISACSATLYLMEVSRVKIHPSVMQLPVHLENEESIVYKPNLKSAIDAISSKQMTQLQAYFHRNQSYPKEAAKKYKYEEFPKHYVFDTKGKTWQERQILQYWQLGRMVAIHPQATGQLFYLRLLLKNKGGVKSFEDLLTVDNHKCKTPKEACIAMELLQDDAQWIACMNEAADCKVSTYPLRNLFCAIILNCEPTDPPALFELFRKAMSEDFLWKRKHMPTEDKEKYANNDLLLTLNDILVQHDKCNADFGMPMPDESLQLDAIDNEEEYDPQAEEYFNENYPLLNEEQRAVFDFIKQCIDKDKPCLVHVDSPAGSGKTFVGNAMLSYVRKNQRLAISTAMTGIAAILLILGTTAHKRFGFPIPCIGHSTSKISFDSKQARLLKEADLIIIDEVSCMTCWLFECLDRFLKELMGNDEVMGGKRVVLMGDFRQALPIVKHGSRAKIILDSIKSSELWRSVKTLRLKRNMRVEKLIRPDSTLERKKQLEDYTKWLLSVGDGTAPTVYNNIIEVPSEMVCHDVMELEDCVYNDFNENDNFENPKYLRGRAILSSTNDIIQNANISMVKRLEGEIQWVKSVDECIDDDDKKIFDAKQLNKIEASGIPPFCLPLKKNACIILIRNLNLKHRHVNGTRCIIKEIKPHVIKATLLDGGKYPEIFIPKIPIVCGDTDFPARFRRTQFPILLAYYLTFNRAQGQSLERVGMRLHRSVFTHGLLYIGMSRSGDPMFIFIYADQNEFQHLIDKGILDPSKTYTRNIVYPEIFYEHDMDKV